MEKAVITVKALKKTFGHRTILENVSFFVPEGSIYALLGSNGAGKTTTIKILTAQLVPDGGEAEVGGFRVQEQPHRIREIISLTGQFSAVDELLTGRENLRIMGRLRQISEPAENTEELLGEFQLLEAGNRPVSAYSGGMKRRLDIAMSLVGRPKILFLDEPTTGLDPQSRRRLWEKIRALKQEGVTVFLTTQYLEEAEELADRIGILDKGKIIAQGTADELKAHTHREAVEFWFKDQESMEKAKLLVKGNHAYKIQENHLADALGKEKQYRFRVITEGEVDALTEIFHIFYENRISICQFVQKKPDLEDVFLEIIGKENGYEHI